MENKVLASGDLGSVGHYSLEWKDNCLQFSLSAKVGPIKLNSSAEVDSAEALDEIAKAIPGTFDDVVISAAKALLLKK